MGIAPLLTYTLTLQRSSNTQDAGGGIITSWPTALASVASSVQPASGRVRSDFAVRQQSVTHMIYTNVDLDAAVSGGVKLGDRWLDAASGLYYLVRDYYKRSNPAISPEPLCVTICELIRA